MKKTTRITALLLALLFILTGCAGQTGESTTATDAGTSLGTTTAEKTAPETLTVYALNAGNTSNMGYVPRSRSMQRLVRTTLR